MRAVARYVIDCRVTGVRPSYLGYERGQQLTPDAPSGTLVRNRMRDSFDLSTWPEVVTYASGTAA